MLCKRLHDSANPPSRQETGEQKDKKIYTKSHVFQKVPHFPVPFLIEKYAFIPYPPGVCSPQDRIYSVQPSGIA